MKLIGILILLVFLPVTLIFVSRIQNYRSSAASIDNLEAESGVVSGRAETLFDSKASGGQFVRLAKSEPNMPTPTTDPGAIEGWKTFRENNFSIQYPSDWMYTNNELEPIFYPINADIQRIHGYSSPLGLMIEVYQSEYNPENCTSPYCPTVDFAEDITIGNFQARRLYGTEWRYLIGCNCRYESIVIKNDNLYYEIKAIGRHAEEGPAPDVDQGLIDYLDKMASTFRLLDNYYVNSTANWSTFEEPSDMSFKYPESWTPLIDGAMSTDPEITVLRDLTSCSQIIKTEVNQGASIDHCILDSERKIIVATPIINHYVADLSYTYPISDEEYAIDIFYKILSTAYFHLY